MSRKLLLGIVIVIILVAVGIYFLMVPGGTQKTYRIGILSGLDFFADTADGFKEKMAELGRVENKNVVYDVWKTNFDETAYERILYKFVADNVDLIFVFPTEASLVAKKLIQRTDIPVVFGNVNIEGIGLVNSVREPGGNITGVRYPGPDLALKRFEIMRELVPNATQMWVAYQKKYPIVELQLEILRPAAVAAGVTITEVPASDAAELQANLETLGRSKKIGPDAILLIAEPLAVTADTFEVMARFAAERNIPIGGASITAGNYESLFGVSTDNMRVGEQAAVLADKILKGISAGTIPVTSAESFLQINYRAAQKMGIIVPEGLLNRANQIIR